MSNFRNTNDLKKIILVRAGELDTGTSSLDTRALQYLNDAHQGLVAGGNEFGIDTDEPWTWAKAKRPIVLTLQPAYETGTVTLTKGSTVGTFSDAPSASQLNRYLKIESRDEYFRIREHTAAATGFEIDQEYTEDTGTFNFKSIQLDYELVDNTIIVNTTNNKIDFEESAGSALVATLTNGVYSADEYATEVKARLEAAGAKTYTITFSTLTRKFTVAHGGAFLKLLFDTGTNVAASAGSDLGFDEEDQSGAITYTAQNVLNAIQRLIRPMTVFRNTIANTFFFQGDHNRFNTRNITNTGKIFGIDNNTMLRHYPLISLSEGTPDKFASIREQDNGIVTVRFNRFVDKLTRVEVDYIPIARDLKDNTESVPLIPRSYRSYLVHAATYYLMLDKSDNRATTEFQLAAAKLQALVNHNRNGLSLTGSDYGRVIPRRDQI